MKKSLVLLSVLCWSAVGGLSAQAADFKLASPVVKGPGEVGFDSGLKSVGRLPVEYGAKAGQVNTRLFPFTWSNLPAGTKALAVVLDDPDAKPVIKFYGGDAESFLHWIATDIDPKLGGLPDNGAAKASFAQGLNGADKPGYMAPAPPADIPKVVKGKRIHIYRLAVYALSAPTGLKPGFTIEDLDKAMDGKILGTAELYLSYSND